MSFLKFYLSFSLCLLLSGFVFAQAKETAESMSIESKQPVPSRPLFKADVNTLYYDFKGRHPADGNIYGFDGVNYAIQAMDLSYLISPTWLVTLSGKHIRNYAETYFLGELYKDTTQGFGDTKLQTTKTFINGSDIYIADVGVSLPTGSITEKNKSNPDLNYPFNMQLGSGTYNLEASLMYLKTLGRHQLGGFGMATIRTGRNQLNYRRGDEYIAKTWYAYVFKQYLMPGLWLNYHHIQRLHGEEPTYGRNIFVEFYHTPRHFWDLTLNVNSQIPLSKTFTLKGLIAKPLWQESKNIDNVQVYAQWFAQLGVSATF